MGKEQVHLLLFSPRSDRRLVAPLGKLLWHRPLVYLRLLPLRLPRTHLGQELFHEVSELGALRGDGLESHLLLIWRKLGDLSRVGLGHAHEVPACWCSLLLRLPGVHAQVLPRAQLAPCLWRETSHTRSRLPPARRKLWRSAGGGA